MKVIFFDTETTGLDFKESRIIELAMLIVEDGKIEEYDEFINVGFDLPSKITEITGITDDMLITEGISEATFAEDLKNYFWSHATEIFKSEKKFTKAEAEELYGFILDEGKGNNQYFKLLNSAIVTLGLSTQQYLVEILNQDDNFKNILTLKNGEEEEKEKAYKSILKSLVKQRLNQKGGFVAGAYLKYYEKQITRNKQFTCNSRRKRDFKRDKFNHK